MNGVDCFSFLRTLCLRLPHCAPLRPALSVYFSCHDQVTEHRQTQLDRRWGAAPRPLEQNFADLADLVAGDLVDLVDLGDLGAELEAAGVDEEHGGSVPAGHGLGLGLGLGLRLGLGLGLRFGLRLGLG